MEELLVQYATELLVWLESAAAFTQEQLPHVVEEILIFGAIKAKTMLTVAICVNVIILGLNVGAVWLGIAIDDMSSLVMWVITIPGQIGTIIWLVYEILNLAMINNAPRLYLIAQISKYLGG